MRQPRVSVLIDTYNYGRFIGEAIESVLGQDFPEGEVEILVVDDGSTDDTCERVRRFGSRVQYHYKANGGQASAVNFGVARAVGEIVALLDADDYWLPGKIARVVQEFENNHQAGMVHHRLKELDTRTGELREGQFVCLNGNLAATRASVLSFHPTAMSSLAFRRSVLEKIVPISEAITIQADGYMQAVALFLAPVAGINESLGVYRFHGANLYFLSETEKDKDQERRKRRATTLRAIVEALGDWFPSHGYDLSDPAVRATVSHWNTLFEREQFILSPPGRVRFFRHLLESNRNHSGAMTWQLKLINYMNAGSLLVGYEHFHKLDRLRLDLTRRLRTLVGKNSASL